MNRPVAFWNFLKMFHVKHFITVLAGKRQPLQGQPRQAYSISTSISVYSWQVAPSRSPVTFKGLSLSARSNRSAA